MVLSEELQATVGDGQYASAYSLQDACLGQIDRAPVDPIRIFCLCSTWNLLCEVGGRQSHVIRKPVAQLYLRMFFTVRHYSHDWKQERLKIRNRHSSFSLEAITLPPGQPYEAFSMRATLLGEKAHATHMGEDKPK
jgi:hypothetical protein